MKSYKVAHLVKGEDLNHHGTLFAGRMAEWFTEACFVAAASKYGKTESIVCVKIHGMRFSAPMNKGDIITLRSKVVTTGTTSITVYGKATRENDDRVLLDGFITFVVVDENGNKMPHNLEKPQPSNEEEAALIEEAKKLR
ncbi:acyl-CoA hydrolase [Natronincola peptidivorans]|uniref:Acyl-CoA hydrolase n=1 Tax=Natronincola peptidivorans TaxID=426128 RepID=A0A1I0DWI9_9FIRM|nr:acyl-CoA thioesterase [Natronincola peptidivorans]SET37000.1 acyl-CoA hydrolase [Natronincola peptidivorans]